MRGEVAWHKRIRDASGDDSSGMIPGNLCAAGVPEEWCRRFRSGWGETRPIRPQDGEAKSSIVKAGSGGTGPRPEARRENA